MTRRKDDFPIFEFTMTVFDEHQLQVLRPVDFNTAVQAVIQKAISEAMDRQFLGAPPLGLCAIKRKA